MCPSFICTSSAPSAEWGLAMPGPRGTKGYKLCSGVACVCGGSLVCNLLPSPSLNLYSLFCSSFPGSFSSGVPQSSAEPKHLPRDLMTPHPPWCLHGACLSLARSLARPQHGRWPGQAPTMTEVCKGPPRPFCKKTLFSVQMYIQYIFSTDTTGSLLCFLVILYFLIFWFWGFFLLCFLSFMPQGPCRAEVLVISLWGSGQR